MAQMVLGKSEKSVVLKNGINDNRKSGKIGDIIKNGINGPRISGKMVILLKTAQMAL
jgi:hypothetical protein